MSSLKGMPIQYLNGIDENNTNDLVGLLGLDGSDADEQKMYDFLLQGRKAIADNPSAVKNIQNPTEMLRMFDYAIKYFYTPQRDEALDILEKEEARLIAQGAILSGFDDNGQPLDGLFSKIKDGLKKVVKTVGDRAKAAVITAIPASKKVFDVAKALVNKPSTNKTTTPTPTQATATATATSTPTQAAPEQTNTSTTTNTQNKTPDTMENPNPSFVEKYITPKNLIIGGIILVAGVVGYKMMTKKDAPKAIASSTPALNGVRKKRPTKRQPAAKPAKKAGRKPTRKVKSVRVR